MFYVSGFVDVCDPNPCENNGSCIASGDGYICNCTDGYTGATVQYLLIIVRMIATMMRMTVTPAKEPAHHSQ